MLRKLTLAVLAVAFCAFVASAIPPPANGGYLPGWGMNPNPWDATSGNYYAWGIYDPLAGGNPCFGWVVGYTTPGMAPIYITYADISLELWIEMFMELSYEFTSYQWHRVGENAETISFCIEGVISSNHPQWVCLTEKNPAQPLSHLQFIEDIFGNTGPMYGTNIAIMWTVEYGTGAIPGLNTVYGPTPVQPDPDLCVLIEYPCTHWFRFCGTFCLVEHVADGYYTLIMGGCAYPNL